MLWIYYVHVHIFFIHSDFLGYIARCGLSSRTVPRELRCWPYLKLERHKRGSCACVDIGACTCTLILHTTRQGELAFVAAFTLTYNPIFNLICDHASCCPPNKLTSRCLFAKDCFCCSLWRTKCTTNIPPTKTASKPSTIAATLPLDSFGGKDDGVASALSISWLRPALCMPPL